MSYIKSSSIKSNLFFSYFKGLLLSIILTFGLVILLAFSLKWFSLADKYITPLNLVIKIVCVVIGSFIAIKGSSKGLLKGSLFGLLYILLAFFSFSILVKSFSIDLSLFLDIICSCVAGGIVGIIKVNKTTN